MKVRSKSILLYPAATPMISNYVSFALSSPFVTLPDPDSLAVAQSFTRTKTYRRPVSILQHAMHTDRVARPKRFGYCARSQLTIMRAQSSPDFSTRNPVQQHYQYFTNSTACFLEHGAQDDDTFGQCETRFLSFFAALAYMPGIPIARSFQSSLRRWKHEQSAK